MFRSAVILAALAAVSNGFVCMTDCRKPLWTCINKGIPGHEIAKLQACVINDIASGMWDSEVVCKQCFDSVYGSATTWPTAMPVTPVAATPCDQVNRKKTCETDPTCIWTLENTSKGECMDITASRLTPAPTVKEGYIDEMQPCLTYCRDQAMDCAFTHGVNTQCVPCMRECVHKVAFDSTDPKLYKPSCGQCIADVFSVLGDPQIPPAEFALFSDYQKWMKNKGVDTSCNDSGGKWKAGKNKTRCVPPKSPKQMRCKKIKDQNVCRSIKCTFNTKKNRCAGAHKWKTAKSGKKNKGL